MKTQTRKEIQADLDAANEKIEALTAANTELTEAAAMDDAKRTDMSNEIVTLHESLDTAEDALKTANATIAKNATTIEDLNGKAIDFENKLKQSDAKLKAKLNPAVDDAALRDDQDVALAAVDAEADADETAAVDAEADAEPVNHRDVFNALEGPKATEYWREHKAEIKEQIKADESEVL